MEISAAIREKVDWERKKDDPAIVARWRRETQTPLRRNGELLNAEDGMDDVLSGNFVTREMMDYALAELTYYQRCIDGPMQIAGVDGVWRADNLIEVSLRNALRQQVALLENVPDDQKDWHPGSNQQVLDLLHPSLYCLVYGVTRVLPNGGFSAPQSLNHIGDGSTAVHQQAANGDGAEDEDLEDEFEFQRELADESLKYQWLPSEFTVSEAGRVSIDSYINNLHPVHQQECMNVIGRVFERFVPMFNKVLNDAYNPRPNRIRVHRLNW